MTTVIDLIADATPTADDLVYVVNDPGGSPGNRKVTLQDLATALAGMAAGPYVGLTGNQSAAGVKTFTTADGVVVVDEAYSAAWNTKLSVPTKNAIYDAMVALTGAQNVAGVKTFTSTPIIPDEAYGIAWNGKLEPPTKNAVYDALVGLPTLSTTTPLILSIYTASGVTYVDYIGGGGLSTFLDSAFTIQDNVDTSKQLQLQLAGLSTATTRTWTVPDLDGTIMLTTGAQDVTGKNFLVGTKLEKTRTDVAVPATETLGAALIDVAQVTLNFAGARKYGTFVDAGQTIYQQAAAPAISNNVSFRTIRTVKNATGVALAVGRWVGYEDNPVFQADGAAVTADILAALQSTPLLGVAGGGTLAVTLLQAVRMLPVVGAGVTIATLRGYQSFATISGGTVTLMEGFRVNNVTPSGGGVLGTYYGVKIDKLSGASVLNMGLSLAGAHEEPPTLRTLTVAADALVSTSAVLAKWNTLDNTSGGSLTLVSTPTLPDGTDGQVAEFTNVGSQNVVIQDQGTLAGSNLRLSANTITLGPRDSIRVRFSATIGDWVQVAQVNVL